MIRRDPRTRKLASEVTVRDFVGCRNTDIYGGVPPVLDRHIDMAP